MLETILEKVIFILILIVILLLVISCGVIIAVIRMFNEPKQRRKNKSMVTEKHSDHDNNRKTVDIDSSAKACQRNLTNIEADSVDLEKKGNDDSTNNLADTQIHIHDQQRKLHKEEVRREREAETLEKKKRTFNPLCSKPDTLTYTNLSVVDGELMESTLEKAAYYRYWPYENRFFFEFFCEESRLCKSINNHSVLIDPFCQKSGDSKPYNEAKSISTIEYGELDSNLKIVSKPLIKYN